MKSTDYSMWGPLFVLTFGIVMYFLDIGFDILVAREQSKRAFARHNMEGKNNLDNCWWVGVWRGTAFKRS